MSINDCGGDDPHCGCVIVWEEGRRFVKRCGELSSTDKFIAQEFAAIRKELETIKFWIGRTYGIDLAP